MTTTAVGSCDQDAVIVPLANEWAFSALQGLQFCGHKIPFTLIRQAAGWKMPGSFYRSSMFIGRSAKWS